MSWRRVWLAGALAGTAAVVSTADSGVVAADTLTAASAAELRARITEANGNPNIDLIEITTATIAIPAGECNDAGAAIDPDDANISGDYDVDRAQDLTIRGVAGRTTITTACEDRFFDHHGGGALRLERLTLDGATLPSIPNGLPNSIDYSGGAVRTATGSSLEIHDSVLSSNSASDSIGVPGVPSLPGDGGAIYARGDITIEDSRLNDNRAGDGGQGDAATDATRGGSGGALQTGPSTGVVELRRTTFADNRAGNGGFNSRFPIAFGGFGGAISGSSNVTIEDSTFERNRAGTGGLGVARAATNGGFGGAINAAEIRATGSRFIENQAGPGGGSVNGPGGSGGNGGAIFSNARVELNDSTFGGNEAGMGGTSAASNGRPGGSGGAVVADTVALDNVRLVNNAAGDGGNGPGTFGGDGGNGGAIAVGDALDGTRVVAADNRAGDGGEGGLPGNGGDGGVFAQRFAGEPAFAVRSSSFDGNRAGDGGDITAGADLAGFGGHGGAIFTTQNSQGALDAVNTTFVRNRAGNSSVPGRLGDGGAVAVNNVALLHVTVTNNTGPAAIANAPTGTPSFDRIAASVFAENSGVNCDLAGPGQSGGDNYEVGGSSCVSPIGSDRVNQSELGLGPISEGPVGVGREPVKGGPLDAAIPSVGCLSVRATSVNDDQFGRARPGGTGCEPGALEIVDVEVLPPGETAARFVELPPTRLFDTRPDQPGDGPKGKVPPGGTIEVQVRGRAGVPNHAVAVAINLTGADATDRGFVTGWPTGIPQPLSSNINLTEPGQVRPNLVIIPLGADGTLSFFSQRGAHLVGDVAGYFVEVTTAQRAGRIVPLGPARLFDTRPDELAPGPKGKVSPGGTIVIPALDRAGIPAAGVAAVIVNLTGTDATDRGFVTAWGDGDRPTASVLNLAGPGATAPNLAIVPVGADGAIRLFSQSGAHLLADVAGYITDGTADELIQGLLVPLAPVRVFDTRPPEPAAGPKGFVAADSTINVPHVDVVGIPADAAGVIINVTASAAADRGFITGWPEGPGRPNSSILNLAGPGDTRPNLAILPIFATGRLSFYASRGAHLLADTFGYLLD